MATIEQQEEIKRRFIELRGNWGPVWDTLLQLDAEFIDAYGELSAVPWVKGNVSPKVKEFVYIALDASTNHLYSVGTRVHVRNAIALGATRDEVMEVLELVSQLGVQTMTVSLPILVEEVARRGGSAPQAADVPGEQLKERYVALHASSDDDAVDLVLSRAPEFFEAFVRFCSTTQETKALTPAERELIHIAVNAAVTHLNPTAIRQHVRAALEAGAAEAEIIEVLELVSVVGVHTMMEAAPIVFEEFNIDEGSA